MYKDCRISVAMATYNGEKYIEEQLNSIIEQTVKVDEIVISDDGSMDNTLSIVQSIRSKTSDICFIILTNSTTHGVVNNFESALKHCTGDYIFLADQDDIWNAEKVERVVDVFFMNPDAHLVFHDAELIDKDRNKLHGTFNKDINGQVLNADENEIIKICKSKYLEYTISKNIANGMVMCVSNWLKNQAIPFPNKFPFHDWWFVFLSIKYDSCYYLNSVLGQYRLHGNNTVGNKAYKGSVIELTRRYIRRLVYLGKKSIQCSDIYYASSAMLQLLDYNENSEKKAYDTASSLYDLGQKLMEIESSNRIIGVIRLFSLYKQNTKYRRSGRNAFLFELAYIMLNSREYRNDILNNITR